MTRPNLPSLAALVLASICAACSVLGVRGGSDAIEVRYEGNTEFNAAELDTYLARFFKDFSASRLKKSAVDDAAFDIEHAYTRAGYPGVRVTYTYAEPAGQKPVAVFTIVEGPHVELVAVKFSGNSAFSRSELEAFFAPPVAGLFDKPDTKYVESDVASAIDEVGVAYASRGFLEADVALDRVEFDATGTRATVHVRVREGPRFRVASIDVGGGDPRIDPALVEAVRKTFVGQPFYERLSVEIQGRLEELYATRGFADVQVTRTKRTSTSDGAVDLGYSIAAGPRITIGAIELSGNEATRSQFVRSRLALHTGQVYSREDERKTLARLFRSGVFERVSMHVTPPADEDQSSGSVTRPVRVEVVESSPIEMFIEPGWGSYERLRLSAGIRHRNLFGTGRILDLHGVVGGLAQSGTLSLIDPWLFEGDIVADVSLFANRREEPSFLRIETGIGTTLTRRFTPAITGSVGYQFRRSDARDVEVLDADAVAALEEVNISEVQASVTHDTRDNVFQPATGSISKFGFEYGSPALGSELHFVRLEAQHASFVPLGKSTVLGLSWKGGWIQPLGTTSSIPLQERFFNGGENTVRSFRESELGPKDTNGEPLGGEAFNVFSAEVRQQLTGRFAGAAFFDIGNVVEQHQDYLEFAGLEQAIGVGLRYGLPVGPIRLDAAVNPDPGEFESRYVVHLSFGMAF